MSRKKSGGKMGKDWMTASRERVDEAMRRGNYLHPKHKQYKSELSKESKEALKQAAGLLERDIAEGGE